MVGDEPDDPVLANAQFGPDDLTVALASRALGSDGGARILRLQSSFQPWANDVFAALRRSSQQVPEMVSIERVGSDTNLEDLNTPSCHNRRTEP